jgi:hypothetical protein
MWKRNLSLALVALALTACNTMGRLTVKNYTAASGERVMAGQAEPKGEYNCQKVGAEDKDWGLKANMNEAAAIDRITTAAVDAAPSKGANYAFIDTPADVNVGIVNVNAFNDAEVVYYKCTSLPAT